MTARDWTSRTVQQAGLYDRANTPDDRETDRDTERVEPACKYGECGEPGCLQDVLWAAVVAEKNEQRRKDWSA